MQKNLIKIAVATALGLVALTAAAEDMYRGAWYAVPGASYMSTDSDLEAKNGGGAFIRLGKELSPKWDIQTGLSYNRANDDIAGSSGHYKQTTFGVDALYMLSRDSFRPFLLTGLGVAHNNVDYSIPTIQDKTKTSWLANIGVGAQYLINDSFGLQADIRQQWSRSNAKAPRPSRSTRHAVAPFAKALATWWRASVASPGQAIKPSPGPTLRLSVCNVPVTRVRNHAAASVGV